MEIELLQEDRLRFWCGRLLIPEGAVEALAQVANEIRADEDLSQVFSAFYEQAVVNGNWYREWGNPPVHPLVEQKMGQRASLFYLLGYMAALPKAEREYRRLGIPLTVYLDTMSDIPLWLNYAHDLHGVWRFDELRWIWRHMDCKLFRLGRLQFVLEAFPGRVTAFRHRETGRILLLGDPETQLRPDGYAHGAGVTSDAKPSANEDTWHAVFEATPAGWRGNRISPRGYTLHEESFLLRSEWERVLKHGDTILDLHIPRGEKLTLEECRDSFKQAFEFFPRYWPDRPFKGVYCHTWFFTPQLQQFLPSDSNIVRFQREFYLYPHPGNQRFLWNFVFGEKYPDPASAPRDTSLRIAVLDWLSNGGELFDLPGVMLHHPDQWGTQPYYPVDTVSGKISGDELPVPMAAVTPLSEDDEDDEDDFGLYDDGSDEGEATE